MSRAVGVALFPGTWKELLARRTCPDWENPCKHIAAVLYVFADQLDTDPWLLLAWRGRTREEILDPLRGSSVTDAAADEVAPERRCPLVSSRWFVRIDAKNP